MKWCMESYTSSVGVHEWYKLWSYTMKPGRVGHGESRAKGYTVKPSYSEQLRDRNILSAVGRCQLYRGSFRSSLCLFTMASFWCSLDDRTSYHWSEWDHKKYSKYDKMKHIDDKMLNVGLRGRSSFNRHTWLDEFRPGYKIICGI